MCCRHEEILDVIIFNRLHSLNAASATVLRTEIIRRHPLHVTDICHRDHGIFIRDQIFHGNVILIVSDGGTTVIAVLVSDQLNLFTDDAKQLFLICKDRLQLRDLFHQLFVFIFNLLAFQTGQRTQTHINDCLCLCICQSKARDQVFFCFLCIAASADDRNNFINVIKCDQQAL